MRSSGTDASLSPARAWTIAGLLFAAGFINYMDRAIVSIALPVIAVDLHLGPAAKGVLLSAFFWSYALMQVPVGWAADRYNLRWFYSAAFALWSLACGFTGFAGSLAALMTMRVVLGIGESIYMPGGMKIVSVLFGPKQRGLASGLMNCGTRAGLAIGAPAIAFLVHARGWHQSFMILGFGSMFWLIPWLAVFPRDVRFERAAPAMSLRRTLATLDRNLLGMSLGHFGYGYYWYLLVTWLPDYLVEARHMSLERAGAYTAIPFLVFAVSEPLGGWIADRLVALGYNERRSRKAVVTVSFFTSIMLLVAGHTADDTTAVLMIGAASLVGLSTGNLYVLTSSSAPDAAVGMWMGILNFSGNVSGVVAPIVTGLLIQRTGSYYPAFVVAVGVLLLALPAYWWMVGEKRQPAEEVAALA
jgi:ACS family D-galactonate transporter-like MFS transporter